MPQTLGLGTEQGLNKYALEKLVKTCLQKSSTNCLFGAAFVMVLRLLETFSGRANSKARAFEQSD